MFLKSTLIVLSFMLIACDIDKEDFEVYDYEIQYPDNYDSSKDYPLIIALHGANTFVVGIHTIRAYLDSAENNFILVTPKSDLPENEHNTRPWASEQVVATLDKVIAEEQIDLERIYLTGLSMGGYGTLRTGAIYPERFAAIAPMAGGIEDQLVEGLETMPVWFFHHEDDLIVRYSESQTPYNKLKKSSDLVKFTTYTAADSIQNTHDAWTKSFTNPELYKWFLTHKRRFITTDD